MTSVLDPYRSPAAHRRYDEAVTELEHALQCADLALAEGASDALVVAALLHDVGHLLDDGNALRASAQDDRHEATGSRHLRSFFGPDVTGPVGLHVEAKRYLVTTDDAYGATLSASSIHSLALQGGPMVKAQLEAFRARPHWEAAVRLRRWDDLAKVADAPTSALEDHEGRIFELASA